MKLTKRLLNQQGIAHHILVLVIAFVALFGISGTYFVVRSNAATPCAKQTLREGLNEGTYGGTCVSFLQAMLNSATQAFGSGYGGTRLTVDGDFGPKTYAQVRRFQTRFAPPVDGIVGPITWHALCYESYNRTSARGYTGPNYVGCPTSWLHSL
jgi:peptidoglycan hydrolase-like protein with peptidoglycan-binding domain